MTKVDEKQVKNNEHFLGKTLDTIWVRLTHYHR